MSMTDESRTVRWCRCDARMHAVQMQTMRFSIGLGGWVLFDVPTRSMSKLTSYYAFIERGSEFPHENHVGEPYVFQDCPWCGLSLPGSEGDALGPFGQSDGAES